MERRQPLKDGELRNEGVVSELTLANTSGGIPRMIFRWIHIILGIPILGYIYDSPSDSHYHARSVRFFFLPVLIISGLWMWKGHLVRRLCSKSPA